MRWRHLGHAFAVAMVLLLSRAADTTAAPMPRIHDPHYDSWEVSRIFNYSGCAVLMQNGGNTGDLFCSSTGPTCYCSLLLTDGTLDGWAMDCPGAGLSTMFLDVNAGGYDFVSAADWLF